MGGSWPAGQRSGPADLDAARLWQRDSRDGGRSLSALRPDSLVRCSALARLLSLPHSCLQMGMVGWVLACSMAPCRARSDGGRPLCLRAVVCRPVPPCALLALGGTKGAEGWLDHTLW